MKFRMPKAVCVTGAALLPPVGVATSVGASFALAYGIYYLAIFLTPSIGDWNGWPWVWFVAQWLFFTLLGGGIALVWGVASHELFGKCQRYWHSND
jgi:hypothetical protein